VISEELISCDKVTMNSTGDIEEAVLERCPSAENEPDYWVLPIFVFFIISGVFGNILVCLAISTNRELQNMTNYFLMSLAVADLLVCLIVMPFGAILFFSGCWPLSPGWCVFYQTCDVLACSVSILHLMFISVGRYRGIRRPLRQRTQGEHSILYKVALTWGLGLLLASPIPVLALLDMKNIMPSSTVCEMNNQHFLIFGSLLAFYIPMVIMVVTYVLTVHHLKNQRLVSGTLTGARHQITKSSLPSQDMRRKSSVPLNSLSTMRNGHGKYQYNYISGTETSHRCCKLLLSRATQTPSDISREIELSVRKKSFTRISQSTQSEEKASRVLGVVFSAFIVCWAPFFIMNLVQVACGQSCAPPAFLGDMSLWLGYAASTINPLIYTTFNIKFRQSFTKLIMCRVGSVRNALGTRNSL